MNNFITKANESEQNQENISFQAKIPNENKGYSIEKNPSFHQNSEDFSIKPRVLKEIENITPNIVSYCGNGAEEQGKIIVANVPNKKNKPETKKKTTEFDNNASNLNKFYDFD